MTRRTVSQVEIRPGVTIPLDIEQADWFGFGFADGSPDDYGIAIRFLSDGVTPTFALMYWRGDQVNACTSPRKWPTPGHVVAARIGGGARTRAAVNGVVHRRWPSLAPDAAD